MLEPRHRERVLDKLPKSKQRAAKILLCAMPYAPTRAEAQRLREGFARRYRSDHPEAVAILEKDWETLTTFYDFPAEHWKHLRTSNVVESPFAALRLRTGAAKRFKVIANATMLIWRVLRVVERRFRKLDAAWATEDPDEAERRLRRLAASLEEAHPGAAAPLREGLEETLTISRLGLSPALVKTFKSTNPIESLNDGIRTTQRNVKNWKSGTMAERWTAAAMLERAKRFRRINGYRDMWLLVRALDRHTKEVTSSKTAA